MLRPRFVVKVSDGIGLRASYRREPSRCWTAHAFVCMCELGVWSMNETAPAALSCLLFQSIAHDHGRYGLELCGHH